MKTDKIDLARDYYFVGVGSGGKTFAFPFYVTSMLLAYNKSLLQKWRVADPWDKYNGKWNWTEFLDTARQVTKPAGGVPPGHLRPGHGRQRGGQHRPQPPGVDDLQRGRDLRRLQDALHPGRPQDDRGLRVPDQAGARAPGDGHARAVGPLAQQAPSSEPFINGIIGFRQESTGRLALYAQNIGSEFEWDVVPSLRDEGAALHRPLRRRRDPGLRQGQERGRGLRRQVHRGRRDAEDHGREQAAHPGPA